MSNTDFQLLTPDMVAAITALFPRYPNKRAVTLPAIHIVNDQLRYVPPRAVVEIAQVLELAPAEVQDTLSFYGIFKQDQPHGLTRAWVCRSVSCMLRGGYDILDHLCHRAGVHPGECTPDGKLTVEFSECLGACEYAPCMLANQDLHKDVTPEKIDSFLDQLGVAAQPPAAHA
ncbi:MAG: NAD(P)H-dependent oxidoreductase subunit E [Pirellulales bacterium]|nr:NAD(P)H-dependent oxidoreductase subunit E [Pirellulales bacterium]